MTRMGVRVIVTPDDAQPAEIAHAKLFVPNMTPVPAAVTDAERIKPSLVAMAGDKTAEASTAPTAAVKLLSPLERAKVEKAQMVVDAPAKAKAAKEAAEVSAVKAAEANKAIKALREAEQALAAARDRSEAAAKAVEQAKTPEAAEKAKAAQAPPRRRSRKPPRRRRGSRGRGRQDAGGVRRRAGGLGRREGERRRGGHGAGGRARHRADLGLRQQEDRPRPGPPGLDDHPRRAGNLQGSGSALGTHVYVATEMVEDGKAMRWLSVTLPHPSPRAETRQRGGATTGAGARAGRCQPGQPRETATGALDRIVITEETGSSFPTASGPVPRSSSPSMA
jgi:hypothetical protein